MEPEQKSNGALIGLIVIVIILIIGGIYLWKTSLKENAVPAPVNSTVGSADNSANLEASVNDINLDNLDSGI